MLLEVRVLVILARIVTGRRHKTTSGRVGAILIFFLFGCWLHKSVQLVSLCSYAICILLCGYYTFIHNLKICTGNKKRQRGRQAWIGMRIAVNAYGNSDLPVPLVLNQARRTMLDSHHTVLLSMLHGPPERPSHGMYIVFVGAVSHSKSSS